MRGSPDHLELIKNANKEYITGTTTSAVKIKKGITIGSNMVGLHPDKSRKTYIIGDELDSDGSTTYYSDKTTKKTVIKV